MKANLKESNLEKFDGPTSLPKDDDVKREWQDANKSWWEANPMRYDWRTKIEVPQFSVEYYAEIDERFYSDARTYLPWQTKPFEDLVDFRGLATKNVLEIGVGNGSHAELLATSARSYTGIDLTQFAVESTTRRLQLKNVSGTILQMDAELMNFGGDSFDLVWSWGVIHHSANTEGILKQIRRVLRPGGQAIIMVYHRNWWNMYVIAGFFHGVLRGEFFEGRSIHEIMQRWTDGAIARFYTVAEWKAFAGRFLEVEEVRIMGSKAELFPLPPGALKRALMRMTPDALTRFFLNSAGMGTYLVSKLRKPR